MNKTIVTVYRLPCKGTLYFEEREKWLVERLSGFMFDSKNEGEQAAEEAFHITNAPQDLLNDEQKKILQEQQFQGPAVSVGDIIKIEPKVRGLTPPEYFLCKSFGWEKYQQDVIQLLKYLS